MKKPTQRDKILKLLRDNGQISRNYCLKTYLSSRLGAYICDFKREGMNIESKHVENDFVYYLLDKPKETIEYRVDNKIVWIKKIW